MLHEVAVLVLMVLMTVDCSNKEIFRQNCNSQDGTLFLIVGEWVEADCRLKNNSANIHVSLWQKNAKGELEKRTGNETKIKMIDNNLFRISNLQRSDNGVYYCTATYNQVANPESEGCFIIRISVNKGVAFAEPLVFKIPDRERFGFGDNVILRCLHNGSSIKYEFNWYKVTTLLKLREIDGSKVRSFSKSNMEEKHLIISDISVEDEGTYMCKIWRKSYFSYSANKTVKLILQESLPIFNTFYGKRKLEKLKNQNISFHYNVSSNPEPNITWYQMKDRVIVKKLAFCPRMGRCETELPITRNRFFLTARYPEDNNSTLKCVAENMFGRNENKSFLLIVYAEPEIKTSESLPFSKGMRLNCTIKEANPVVDNYAWHICPKDSCNNNWKFISNKPYVTLSHQKELVTLYRCSAGNTVGNATATFKVIGGITDEKPPIKNISTQPILVAIGIITAMGFILVTFVLWKRKKIYGGFYIFSYPPLPDYMEQIDITKDIQLQLQKLPFISEWEFPRKRITLVSELGMGEFGLVWLGHAIGISDFHPRENLKQKTNKMRLSTFFRSFRANSYVLCKDVTKVAVKQLKDNWDKSKLTDLQTELKVLIHVGEHENIVNLLGACTKGKSFELWMVLEYCPYGNIKTFLRNKRDIYNIYGTTLTTDFSDGFGSKDIELFALQITKGMEFLSSRKIIHRDLAARNVLIGEGYVAKIADFGLARDIYMYETYVRKSSGVLPLKWMAIESIKESVFTEKTDIWSFGILLWELFTLGGSPYPGVPVNDLYNYLSRGNRMELPLHCPPQISQIMITCWKEVPDNRPTFKDLVETLTECTGNVQRLEAFTTSRKESDTISDEGVLFVFSKNNNKKTTEETYSI